MPFIPYELCSYLGPYGPGPHLFAVMNDPCKDGLCLTLMISSIKDGKAHDATCVLNVGDHPFVKKPSSVVYRLATTARAIHIGSMVDKKVYVHREDWDPAVFNRIAQGIYQSDNTSLGMVKYAAANNI